MVSEPGIYTFQSAGAAHYLHYKLTLHKLLSWFFEDFTQYAESVRPATIKLQLIQILLKLIDLFIVITLEYL